MSFAIERQDEHIWLVLYDKPNTQKPLVLAEFPSQLAVDIWTEHYARALLMARECGRMGLG